MSQKIKTSVEIDGSLSASQIQNATVDTDKFLVSDAGVVKYRTGSEILSDLGITVGTANHVQHPVKAGVAINKGQAVYVTNADGTNMIVGLASNSAEATSSKTMGLLNATVSANGFADVITEGLLSGLDTSTALIGNPVWLGTNGNLIYGLANKPSAPNHLVFIGIVTRVNANNGEIFVKVQNGFELDELHDVDLKTTTPINGHLLGFNGTLWVNKTIAGWLGYTPQAQLNGTGFVKASGTTITYDNTSYYPSSNPNGYISSYTETDPTVPSYVKSITSTEKSNWNTAYGWGNHALAGYVPQSRTITINGVGYDLSANRSWTITASETDTLATVVARGNTANSSIAVRNSISINKSDGSSGGQLSYDSSINQLYLWNSLSSGYFSVYTNNAERLNISSGGAVTANVDMRSPIFYDSNNTGYYVDPSSYSNLNNITASSFANESSGLRVVSPGGASSASGSSSVTGAIKVTLPTSWTNTMMRMTIKVYLYSTNQAFEIQCGGYNYAPGTSWINTFAQTICPPGSSLNFNVRFGHDGTNCCIYIGETSSTWAYPQVTVTDFQAGYSNYGADTWNDGWSISFATTFGTISTTQSNTQIGRFTDILYDYNNTGYYLDPSSTSSLNYIAGNRIYAGSDAGVDGSISTNNWFRSVGATGWYNQTYSGGWYMSDSTYVRSYNDVIVITNSSFRSPIFYDINDTAYYTDPASTSNLYGLQLTGASNKYLYINPGNGYEAMVRYNGGSGNTWYAGKRTTGTTQAGTADFHFYSDAAGDTVFGIGADGTIKAKGDVVAYSSSDKQLKDNILPIENALEKVKKIGGYTFDWNDNQDIHKGHDVGVIAQEIEAVLPEIVMTRDNGFKAVKYEKIVALLIEAIKEQQTQIEELKKLVNKLTNK
jgi:hypothetical protein